jgi:flagellar biosynthesis/type III secretory pathway protein FliH
MEKYVSISKKKERKEGRKEGRKKERKKRKEGRKKGRKEGRKEGRSLLKKQTHISPTYINLLGNIKEMSKHRLVENWYNLKH